MGAAGDVYVYATAVDIVGSSANNSYVVNVLANPNQNSSFFLVNSLRKETASGNVNGIYQTINLVSSSLSIVNCSASPNCTALHRDLCLNVVNTCSSCSAGYKGVVGDSNSPCASLTSSTGSIGSPCGVSNDCLYGLCVRGMCVAPPQSCQTDSPDKICSGHGTCLLQDASGNTVQNCTILQSFCAANCVCSGGYGGVDCSFSPAALNDRSDARSGMCSALLHVISVSDRSAQLFDTVATALLSAYDSYQIATATGKLQCSSVVRFLGSMAAKGYLKGTLPSTSSVFTEISSEFVGTGVSSLFTATSGTATGAASQFKSDISHAVSGVTLGTMKTMVQGQRPVSLVTSNVRATMRNELTSRLQNATFSPPLSAAQSSYGSLLSGIHLQGGKGTGAGLASCSDGSGYVQLSTLQFGVNPHSGSAALHSPLLQFGSSTASLTTQPHTMTMAQQADGAEDVSIAPHSNSAVRKPVFYIVLQFSVSQQYNLSSLRNGKLDRSLNVSLPACSIYNKATAKYVSCANCNISSYTNYNATFGCYNIRTLCPAVFPVRHKSSASSSSLVSVSDADYYDRDAHADLHDSDFDRYYPDPLIADNTYKADEEKGGHGVKSFNGRGLGNDDDGSNDGSSSDDQFSSKASATSSEFGSVLQAIAAELSSVLSLNPFAIDLHKATPVLAGVGSFAGCILFGLIFFANWDRAERLEMVYLTEDKQVENRGRIVKDMKNGGDGINFVKTLTNKVAKRGGWSPFTHAKFDRSKELPTADISWESDPLSNAVYIAEFADQVIPSSYTLKKGEMQFERGRYQVQSDSLMDSVSTLMKAHYLTAHCFGSSMRCTRCMRFLEMSRSILLGIFTDTLLFGVYFPSDATCSVFLTKPTCLSQPSKVVIYCTFLSIHNALTSVVLPLLHLSRHIYTT